MYASGEFRRQSRIYHAMALDSALPFEGERYDIDPEMRLAAGPVAGVAFMKMRFVHDVETLRRESFAQLVCDSLFGAHGCGNTQQTGSRQWPTENGVSQCQDLKLFALRSQSQPCRLIHPNSSIPFASSRTSRARGNRRRRVKPR